MPETGGYAVARREGNVLHLRQCVGGSRLNMRRLAASFGTDTERVCLGYTPVCRDGLDCQPLAEEDTTLFVLGRDLKRMERDKMRFPVLSHA